MLTELHKCSGDKGFSILGEKSRIGAFRVRKRAVFILKEVGKIVINQT